MKLIITLRRRVSCRKSPRPVVAAAGESEVCSRALFHILAGNFVKIIFHEDRIRNLDYCVTFTCFKVLIVDKFIGRSAKAFGERIVIVGDYRGTGHLLPSGLLLLVARRGTRSGCCLLPGRLNTPLLEIDLRTDRSGRLLNSRSLNGRFTEEGCRFDSRNDWSCTNCTLNRRSMNVT